MMLPSRLLWVSDRIDPAKYEFNLFCDQSDMVEKTSRPVPFWRVHEFFPSYMLIKTPFCVAGQMPIDQPWLYAWLTILDGESRERGFLLTNLVNGIPPKHITVGIRRMNWSDAQVLKRYNLLREKAKARIEAFWNSLKDWHTQYIQMKEISWQLLTAPFHLTPRKVDAAIRTFESLTDDFFRPLVAPETMDDFYARWMAEVDQNERAFEPY